MTTLHVWALIFHPNIIQPQWVIFKNPLLRKAIVPIPNCKRQFRLMKRKFAGMLEYSIQMALTLAYTFCCKKSLPFDSPAVKIDL